MPPTRRRFRPAAPPAAVLLDAPCTATGTIRRHPDIAHLKTAADVAAMAAVQARLLKAAVEMLAPGGLLVYAVCSLESEEGPERIAALLADGAPVARAPVAAAEIGGLADCVTAAGDLRKLPSHLVDPGGHGGGQGGRHGRVLRLPPAAVMNPTLLRSHTGPSSRTAGGQGHAARGLAGIGAS